MKTALVLSGFLIMGLTGCASNEPEVDPEASMQPQEILTPADTAELREDDPMRNLQQAESIQEKGAHDDLTPEDYALDEDDPAAGIPLDNDAQLIGDEPPARAKGKGADKEARIPNGSIRVFYVKATEAVVRERPKDGSKPVKTLMQGDNVMVTVQGEWGRITERQWIHIEDLTHIPVGRTKSADSTWLPSVK